MNGANVLTTFTADTKDFDKKVNSVDKSISSVAKGVIAATGITKAISAAWNTVTNSLDGAIDRFDTMNNFPKVMSNLGIGAEESKEAISTLSKKLTGLPTALNNAALSVQRLTSKNGDIKKSTDLFLAMNNAILSGGASGEIQSSAIEQLSQAYAKGKPDMMEWRSLMTAMPAQLKQVAIAMGYVDADALGEDLRQGNVSMDSFMDTIVKLNNEGVSGFKSFEEQARNSTGGIKTSMTNMKTAITRGVTNIVSSIDEGLANAGLGGIGEVMSNVGKTFESVLSKVGTAISTFIPKVISLAKWLTQHKTLILAIIVPITTFITVLSTLQKIITAVSVVQGILNAVMAANPIMLIIAAIVALIALLVVLWNNCEGFRNVVIGIFETVVSVVSSIFETVTSIATEIWNFLSPIFNFIKNAIMLYIAIVTTVIGVIFDVLKTIGSWIYDNVINPIVQRWQTAFNFIANTVKNVFSSIANFVKSTFEKTKSFISNIFSVVGGIIKAPINGIIGGINSVLKTMNKIKIPDWVPGLGGKGINFSLIPKLDKGTNEVLGEGLAYLHEGEAVVPKKYNPAVGGLDYLTKQFQDMIASTMTLDSNVVNSASLNLSPKIINNVQVDVKQDPLGQTVKKIKTFSGGAKNDYNYGAGV